MNCKIALVRGDGIGPEIMDQAVKVLAAVGARFDHSFEYADILAGGAAIDACGTPLQPGALGVCRTCGALLLSAVGGPKWEGLPGDLRPERGLLGLRSGLGLYANLRPITLRPELADACPLKPDISGDSFDLMIVRELTGDAYFGEKGRRGEGAQLAAYDTMIYSAHEIERVGRVAFDLARRRGQRLCSIDKHNVLESSRLWREVMRSLRGHYPDVPYTEMLVDNAAMQLIRDPRQFGVIVTGNLFGDILSDEASMLTGSIGMLPSASLGDGPFGMYEPIHGSAPDIAGQDKANPLAMILSTAMMLELSFGLKQEADAVNAAVTSALRSGLRTADIARGAPAVGTRAMGDAVAGIVAGC